MLKPITRTERILSGEDVTPINRFETFLEKAMGKNIITPAPLSRLERILSGERIEPLSRVETYLAYLVGTVVEVPATICRFEYFVKEAVNAKRK